MKPINEIAEKLGIPASSLKFFGHHIAKVSHKLLEQMNTKEDGKLVLVTAVNPTPAGEGKTTTSIGLSMALNRLGYPSIVTLREPSLGPIMGVKGGATGGGRSRVLPSEDINLHFTGDLHAVSAAHNLLSALLDAHLKHGNELKIDVTRIFWRRVIDMNDRALRKIVVGLGGNTNGVPREDGFIITAASEVMAILCLSRNLQELKERLGNIVIGLSTDEKLVRARDLGAQGAMTALLRDAMDPNLVQTSEQTPAFVHGGPFANIAHGTNSIVSTKLALKLSNFTVTETGFGADLGAEKFLNFVSKVGGFSPSVAVVVATVRALKYHGGCSQRELEEENLEKLRAGFENLRIHVENLRKFNIPVVVALNRFQGDTERELDFVLNECEKMGVRAALSEVYEKGGEGGEALAKAVVEASQPASEPTPLYDWSDPIEKKVEILAREVYRAGSVEYTDEARKSLKFLKKNGFDGYPIIVAKTPNSLSHDPRLRGAPRGYTFVVRDFEIAAGAGFVVVLAGDINLMPGLPKEPNALKIDVDEEGRIVGL